MERFSLLAARLGVHVQPGWIANDVHLTKNTRRGRHVITYSHSLPKPLQLLGVGLMLGVLQFDWDGLRFGFRFTKPDDHPVLRQREAHARRDYRKIRKWLAGLLVTDDMRRWLRQGDRSIYDLCEEHDLSRDVVEIAFGIIPISSETIEAERQMWDRRVNGW